MHYLNVRHLTHVFRLGICNFYCIVLYFYALYIVGKKRAYKFEELILNAVPCVFLATMKVYCV